MIKKMLHINGVPKTVIAESDTMLADVLREQLKLTGTKVGCGQGQCGCCSVILDGKVVRSCITKMKRVEDGARVTTIEGIGTPDNLHALQMAWTVHGGAQCGFCSPGFIVSAKALLDENQEPHAQAGPGLVPETPQRLPLHRLQAAGGRGHGRGQGAAGRDDLERPGVQAAGRRPDLGHDLSRGPLPWPRSPAPPITVPTWASKCRPALCGWPWSRPRCPTPRSCPSTPPTPRRCPGSHKVITHKDVKGKNRITGLITFASNKGDGWDRPILCDQKVFQFGDAIAIVAADTEENARAAAEKVKVKLEELPAYMSAPAAMAEDAIEIHPGTPNVYYEQKRRQGRGHRSL